MKLGVVVSGLIPWVVTYLAANDSVNGLAVDLKATEIGRLHKFFSEYISSAESLVDFNQISLNTGGVVPDTGGRFFLAEMKYIGSTSTVWMLTADGLAFGAFYSSGDDIYGYWNSTFNQTNPTEVLLGEYLANPDGSIGNLRMMQTGNGSQIIASNHFFN
jgi:hypothetical protein